MTGSQQAPEWQFEWKLIGHNESAVLREKRMKRIGLLDCAMLGHLSFTLLNFKVDVRLSYILKSLVSIAPGGRGPSLRGFM